MWESSVTKSFIEHSGIRGMHWGVRRYQNPDGTLTEEGKRRYRSNSKIASDGSKIARSSAKAIDSAANLKNMVESQKFAKEAKIMNDDDLKQAVWRLNMEKQYRDLKSGETSKGRDYINSALDIAGSSLAAAASALTIAYTIKQLKS